MQNYAGMVAQVLNTQFADHVVPAAEEEPGKAQLTRAAAWAIYQEDATVGLRAKTSGNQVAGLSVDTIVDRNTGEVVDIATSRPEGVGMVRILPGWYPYAANPSEVANWREPTAALAAMPGPMPRSGVAPGPGPGPDPGPRPDDDAILAALESIEATQAAHTEMLETARLQAARDTASIITRDDLNTEKIQQQLHDIVEDMEETLKQALVLILANRADGGGGEPGVRALFDDLAARRRTRARPKGTRK
jgi:hypothetical protein